MKTKPKIMMNGDDMVRTIITPMVISAFGQHMSSAYVNDERLEQVRKIHENMIYLNAIMENAVEDEETEKLGDQPLVDWMFNESTYLVTRFKHLLTKRQLRASEKAIDRFRKETCKLEKDIIKGMTTGGKS